MVPTKKAISAISTEILQEQFYYCYIAHISIDCGLLSSPAKSFSHCLQYKKLQHTPWSAPVLQSSGDATVTQLLGREVKKVN